MIMVNLIFGAMNSRLENLDFNKIAKQVLNYLADNYWFNIESQVSMALTVNTKIDYDDHEAVEEIFYTFYSKRYLERYSGLCKSLKFRLLRYGSYCFLFFIEIMILHQVFSIVMHPIFILLGAGGAMFIMISSVITPLVRIIVTSYMKAALINPS